MNGLNSISIVMLSIALIVLAITACELRRDFRNLNGRVERIENGGGK